MGFLIVACYIAFMCEKNNRYLVQLANKAVKEIRENPIDPHPEHTMD